MASDQFWYEREQSLKDAPYTDQHLHVQAQCWNTMPVCMENNVLDSKHFSHITSMISGDW